MTRDKLVEAAAEALSIVEVIDAVEPLIRADEREHWTDTAGWRHLAMEANAKAVALMQERDDLRAKVKALHVYATDDLGDAWILRSAVLALLDGGGE